MYVKLFFDSSYPDLPEQIIISYAASGKVSRRLLRVIDGAAFSDDVNFDLTRIFKLRLDTFDDIACDEAHLIVRYDLGLDHDPDFASRLDSERFFDAVELHGDLFELRESFDVVLEVLASRAGSCG